MFENAAPQVGVDERKRRNCAFAAASKHEKRQRMGDEAFLEEKRTKEKERRRLTQERGCIFTSGSGGGGSSSSSSSNSAATVTDATAAAAARLLRPAEQAGRATRAEPSQGGRVQHSRGGACSPADSDVDNILFGTARYYIFDARALNDFYFYSSFSSSSYL